MVTYSKRANGYIFKKRSTRKGDTQMNASLNKTPQHRTNSNDTNRTPNKNRKWHKTCMKICTRFMLDIGIKRSLLESKYRIALKDEDTLRIRTIQTIKQLQHHKVLLKPKKKISVILSQTPHSDYPPWQNTPKN
jgi:hypothetical protein